VEARVHPSPDGEQVVLRLRPHGRALVVPLLVLLTSSAAAGFAAGVLPAGPAQTPLRAVVAAVASLVVVRWSLVPWVRWSSTTVVVTDRRVRWRSGVLRRRTREVPLSRVVDVGLDRTPGQRLLGSGTLVLETAGERGPLVLRDVPRARRVVDELADLLDRDDWRDDDG
jgi:membrane protein YdbS with pleckstrin-like domain